MWQQLGTLAIGTLGLLVSANLLTRQSTRTLRSLRELADLVAALPDGEGKRSLQDRLDEEASGFAENRRRSDARRERNRDDGWWATLVGVVLVGAGFVAIVLSLVFKYDNQNATISILITMTFGMALVLGAALANALTLYVQVRAARRARGDHESPATEPNTRRSEG